ncbi:hypothetical protein, partial [Rhizobium ruizarguesonis]|uniref:hypothetical protein n=1 Tax=Rhizobium ruizarguesonis TaxID=2081791 RepID=UPI001954619B
GRQISQYDQDIACGQLKSDRNPSKNRTQTSRLRQRSANFSSLLEPIGSEPGAQQRPYQCRLAADAGFVEDAP